MGTIISRLRIVALSASLLLTSVVIACGSDDAPAATAVPATAPAIAAPFVPATPVPPEIFVPATIASVADVSPIEAGLLGLGAARTFPEAITQGSETLSGDEASIVWTEFLSDSRVIDSQNVNMVDFCADGTGYFFAVTTASLAEMAGEEFTWEVFPSVGGRWNEPKIRFIPDDSSILLGGALENFYDSILRVPRPGEGPNTGQTNNPGILSPNEADSVFEFGDAAETICQS